MHKQPNSNKNIYYDFLFIDDKRHSQRVVESSEKTPFLFIENKNKNGYYFIRIYYNSCACSSELQKKKKYSRSRPQVCLPVIGVNFDRQTRRV